MKIFAFASALLLLLAGFCRADSDPFYAHLSSQLRTAGLPISSDSTIGEDGGFGNSESTALGSFWLVKAAGDASKDVLPVTDLPFQKVLRVQSKTAPDESWQQRVAQFIGGTWKMGDVGLLVFSVHSVASETQPSLTVAVTGTDTIVTDESHEKALSYTRVTASPKWTTVYIPFSAPGDLNKALLTFYFASERQTIEIGGLAVYNLGSSITLDALKASIAKLPTGPASTAGVP